jgi:hypothetical protein
MYDKHAASQMSSFPANVVGQLTGQAMAALQPIVDELVQPVIQRLVAPLLESVLSKLVDPVLQPVQTQLTPSVTAAVVNQLYPGMLQSMTQALSAAVLPNITEELYKQLSDEYTQRYNALIQQKCACTGWLQSGRVQSILMASGAAVGCIVLLWILLSLL